MKTLLLAAFLLTLPPAVYTKPLINEISTGGSEDWVEITLTEGSGECDISQYFVTMYYGTNEKISDEPVTLRDRDLPETPWDDRFAVVHFTQVPVPDETDTTGDTNRNGILDLYCCNYGLWNTDCVVSIDTDDDPANGGISDFAALSNRDGTINSTIAGYIESAITHGEWQNMGGVTLQESAVDIGAEGLTSYSTVSRLSTADTGTFHDFAVTPFATPGRMNLFQTGKEKVRLFSCRKKITHRSGSGMIKIPIFIYRTCSIRIRIFNSTGFILYSSGLISDVTPGSFEYPIPEKKIRGRIRTGLYPVHIECAGEKSASETATIFLIISGGLR